MEIGEVEISEVEICEVEIGEVEIGEVEMVEDHFGEVEGISCRIAGVAGGPHKGLQPHGGGEALEDPRSLCGGSLEDLCRVCRGSVEGLCRVCGGSVEEPRLGGDLPETQGQRAGTDLEPGIT